MQARMSQIVGAQNFDRLFLARCLKRWSSECYSLFARTEAVAGEIEERFALHLSIVASQITGLPVELVEVLPSSCGSAVSS